MISYITDQISNFFLHIQINTVNLEYSKKLPESKGSNSVSSLLRKLFESNGATKIFGINLAAAMMVVPLLSNPQEEVIFEPPLNYQTSDIVITDSYQPELQTKTREYILPVENLRFVGQRYHAGHAAYDLNSYVGDDVYAFSSGRVHKIEDGLFGLGRYIILDHGHGLTSVYAHLKNFSVQIGEVVDAGEKIGEIGMTGNTTGPHLHFEIYDNGSPINPKTYLGI